MAGRAVRQALLVVGGVGVGALAALLLAPGAAASTGGPDGCGYTWIDSASPGGPAYDFVDLSATGAATGLEHEDDTAWDVTLPFPFTWCYTTYTEVRTSSNGYLCFIDPASDCGSPGTPGWTPYASNGSPSIPTPGGDPPWPAVFAYYSDLYATHCSTTTSTSCTSHQTFGTAPNRTFIYMEKAVGYCCSASPQSGTFEIKLFEATNCAEVHYSAVSDPSNSHHTIGGVTETDVDGMSYFDTDPGASISAMAVRYCQTTAPPPRCDPAVQSGAPGPFAFTAMPAPAGWPVPRGVPPLSWSAPNGSPSSQAPATPGNAFATTLSTPGLHTVRVTDSAGASSDCTVTVVVPGCGYTVQTAHPYNFTDLWATGGTPASGGATSDDGFEPHPLNGGVGPAFTFNLCGRDYTTVNLSSNGYVCFDTTNWCGDYPGQPLPDPWSPRAAVFGYWSDLYPPGCGGGACVRWQSLGAAPQRVFIYEMQGVGFYGSGGVPPLTFEIKLFETSNCIEVHYKDVRGNGNAGHTVTSGYQNHLGTAGYEYAHAGPGWARNATAWRACPFGAGDDSYTLNEDQPAATLDVLANDNGAGSPLTLIGHTAAAKGTVTLAGGTLVYEPFPDAVGADSFEYMMEGAPGDVGMGRVSIAINPVNDPPLFTGGGPIHWAPTYGPYVGPGWATGVAAGPTAAIDEEAQAIEFELVSVSNPGLFAVLPTLERSGSPSAASGSDPPTEGAFAVLKYAPSGASGLATACFLARDGGGTDTVTTSGVSPALSDTGVDTSEAVRCATIVHNSPPLAHFVANAEQAEPGQAVAFDPCPGAIPYRCSHDPDGRIVHHAWDFGDGATASHPSPVHAFPSPGRYLVRLTVTDDTGLTASTVRILPVGVPAVQPVRQDGDGAPAPPMADAGPDLEAREGEEVAVAGTARGAGERAAFEWAQVGGPAVQVADAAAPTLRFQAPPAAAGAPVQLAFSLRVVDGALVSAPDHVLVTVHSRNHAPEPAAGGTLAVAAGQVVALDGRASRDPDGDALTFSWRQVGGPDVTLVDADHAVATFTAPAAPADLVFRVVASDGRASAEDAVVVHVRPAESAPAGPSGPPAVEPAKARPVGEPADAGPMPLLLAAAVGLAVAGMVALLLVRRTRGA